MKIKDFPELELELLVRLMRDSGIKRLSYGDALIELGDALIAPQEPSEPSRFEDESPKEKLSCGHFLYEANELGECLHGCVAEQTKEE